MGWPIVHGVDWMTRECFCNAKIYRKSLSSSSEPAQCLFVLLPTCISRLCVLIRGCQSLFRACHLHLLKRVRWACHLHLLKIVRWACHLHLLKRVRWGCHLHLVNRVRWGCHLHVVAHPILSLKGRWWPPPSYFKG